MSMKFDDVVRRLAYVLLSLLACPVLAQPDPCDAVDEYLPIVGPSDSCVGASFVEEMNGEYVWKHSPDPAPFVSPGWHAFVFPYSGESTLNSVKLPEGVPAGFRSGFNVLTMPGPGDYLTPAPSLGLHSTCLLPPGATNEPTDWQGLSRTTLHRQVDLVTGLPLIQVTDLELPFAGSTFRLKRTRSGTRKDNIAVGSGGALNGAAADRFWDWTGMGWMASENPLLIIDSAIPDIVGDNPRTTYLVLDAHHTIPFQQFETTGEYEAPPRFRARLTHNGIWGSGTWAQGGEPTQYEVFLYEGQLHYTFVVVREDVPPNAYCESYVASGGTDTSGCNNLTPSSYHDRPVLPGVNGFDPGHQPWANDLNPGFGIPYYGICVKIEDNSGHIVEINYCSSTSDSLDDPASANCKECLQRINRKGQIKYIRLKSTDGTNETTHWTLLYVHRRFIDSVNALIDQQAGSELDYIGTQFDPDLEQNSHIYELMGTLAIDRIYVFEGEPSGLADNDLAGENGCLEISHLDPHSMDDAGTDPLAAFNANLVDEWSYAVRYYYEHKGLDVPGTGEPLSPSLLIRTKMSTRVGQGFGAPITDTNRVFYYDMSMNDIGAWGDRTTSASTNFAGWNDANWDIPWLEAVFEEPDLQALMNERVQLGYTAAFTVAHLARWRSETTGYPLGTSDEDLLLPFASYRAEPLYGSWDWPSTNGTPEAPAAADLVATSGPQGQYLLNDKARLRNDNNYQTPAIVNLRDEDGRERAYRINRLIVLPSAYGNPAQFHLDNYISALQDPFRSAYVNPYTWQAFTLINGDSTYADAPDLTQPRWIAIIDEFESWEDADATVSYQSQGGLAIKAGQLSRRVVEMNPTGYILRDRAWTYSPSGVLMAGGGLGEQFIYKTTEQYFIDENDALPGDSEWDTLRSDIVLTQHRSVGWSASEAASTGESQGLVRFFDYKWFTDAEINGGDVPYAARVQQVAEGIKRGSADPSIVTGAGARLYTRQVLRDPERPTSVLCEVQFTEPVNASSLLTTPPALTGAPPAGMTVQQYITEWVPDIDRPETEEQISARMVVGAPRQLYPNSSWYYPVEREFYSEEGNSYWSATGLLANPTDPQLDASDPDASLIFTFYNRDSSGRSTHTVMDANASTQYTGQDSTTFTTEPWPDTGWSRIPAGNELAIKTTFKYDKKLGLTDVYYPNGRRWARRIVKITNDPNHPEPYSREFVFNDLYDDGSGLKAWSPGEVNDYGGEEALGEPNVRRRVEFSGTVSLSFGQNSQPAWTEYWRVEFGLDSSGRVQQADLIEQTPFGEYAVGSKFINDLGAVYREQEIDGTITRLTRNPLGHVLRRYQGVNDSGWAELGEPGDQSANWPSFDMMMLERYEYGSGINDAWQPISTRRYESQVGWWEEFYDAAPSPDPDGIATVTSYDWRMRPVRMDSYAKGDPFQGTPPDRLETTLTYLDHADRPRLAVTFGAGALGTLPTALDPVKLKDTDPIPPPEDFYTLPIAPTSIVQSFYGPDGTMNERRDYDLGWDGSGSEAPFHAEYHYSGRGGKEVYSQSPSQPLRVTRLDDVGRVESTASLLPGTATGLSGHELERTDYEYNDDGLAIESRRWIRVDPSGDELTTTNAVRTRTVSWYDVQKRLIATADLGTEQGASGFVAGSEGSFTPDQYTPPTWNGSVVTPPTGFPADALLWFYVYDRYGNRTHSIDPEGVVTEFAYTSTGRIETKTENANAANPEDRRVTEFGYQYGRVKSMTMHRTVSGGGGSTGEAQASVVEYQAPIVDKDFNIVSQHNGMIASMEMLGNSGNSPQNPDIELRYNFAGQVAERIDERGVVFRYHYDDLARVDAIEIGWYDAGVFVNEYPGSMTGPDGQNPADRVGYLDYVYDTRGRLAEVFAYDMKPPNGFIITHNQYAYNDRDLITADRQSQGAIISPMTTPTTGYSWEYAETDLVNTQTGTNRITSIVYPTHDGSTPRTVTLGYGTSGSADDLLARIVDVDSNFATAHIADFDYVGVGRRRSKELAAGELTQRYQINSEIGMAGLDLFGRSRDIHYQNANVVDGVETMFRAEYYYDKNSNRTGSKVTQVDATNGGPLTNVRSQVNAFDELNRLVGTDYGELVLNGNDPEINSVGQIRADEWGLDLLGNWSGTAVDGGSGVGRTSSGNLDGYGTPYQMPNADATDDLNLLTHAVNDHNEITGVTLLQDGTPLNAGQDPPRYDEAGNLSFDGDYYYQYDAWNRLLQVNEATVDSFGDIVLGDLVKTFMYDGLGRLVRTQTPAPSGSTSLRTERFYYDGLRRIQELVLNPTTTLGGAQGNQTLESIASQTVNPETNPSTASAPAGYEEGQQGLSGGGALFVAREYVWGPGDAGFDELLVQYDQVGDEAWAVVDAGGDLVAMCDLNGTDSQGGLGLARVVGQWLYDAYGEVVVAEYIHAFGEPHLGHKGMFLARFDGAVNSPRLVPYAHSVYHMRNRTYAPQLGRFMQRDPNQTAMALVEATAMHGRGLGAISLAFDLEGLYGDGGNLYEYLGSNPWTRSDPLGLSWDPFDMVDEYLAESTGSRAAFLNQIGQDAKAIAIVGATIASYLPVPIVGSLGDMALFALGEQSGGELAAGLAIGLVPGGKLLGRLGSFIGDIGGSAWSAAKHYAQRHGRSILRSNPVTGPTLTLGDEALEFVRRKPKAACGCFAAGTLVWTPAGPVPIDDVDAGMVVLAMPDDGLASNPLTGTVSHQITIGHASLVLLTVRHEDGSTETIATTDEHPFHEAETASWTRADQLRPGARLSGLRGCAEVVRVAYPQNQVPVYNLSIPGMPTYYIGNQGLWVHNCIDFRGIRLSGSLREPLAGANRAELERAFSGTGLVPTGHFIDRLADHRLRKSGMTTLADVQALLRNGRQILQADRGNTIKITNGKHYIAINPRTKALITIAPD